MNTLLQIGQTAPNFTLSSSAPTNAGEAAKTVSLADFKGKNVVLLFYPADWSAVCGDELALYNQVLPMLQKLDAEVLGISVDSAFCHGAFKTDRGFKLDLLADFEPKGAVAKQYGAYDDKDGFSQRALFVVDAGGVIRYSFLSPMDVNPGASEVLKTLKNIQTQGRETPRAETDLTAPVGANDRVQGDQDTAVTLVEYGDYECPACGEAYAVIKRAQERMGNKMRLVFRNFPLSDMHPHAARAAGAAEAAGAQGQFWPMHDLLYQNQGALEDDDLAGYARQLGLDERKFAAEMSAEKFAEKIQADFESGVESGVNGTPCFFINGARFDADWQSRDLLQSLQNAAREA